VERRVGEGDARQLGLEPINQVTEDPPAAADALAIPLLLAVAAAAAGGDAGDEDAVAGRAVVTAVPTSSTVPTASWLRIVPGLQAATSPLRMWRSVPQIVAVSMRTTASVAARSAGSGTSSSALRALAGFPG
jgi:hypothetical protein